MTFSGSLAYINPGKFVGAVVFANVYAFSRSYGFAFASVAVPALIALGCLPAEKNRKASSKTCPLKG